MDAPTNLEITNIRFTTLTATWLASAEAVSYKVYVDSSYIATTANLTYDFTELERGRQQIIGVVAVDADDVESEMITAEVFTLKGKGNVLEENINEMIEEDATTGDLRLKVDASIEVSDISIGAVEMKDATTDARAKIVAANAAKTAATNVLVVQQIDAEGNIGGGANDIDDSAFTPGTGKGQVIMGVHSGDVVNEGDKGAFRMTLDRKLMVDNRITADGYGSYANRKGDFTATPTIGSNTITITGLPFTLEAEHVLQIRKRNTSTGSEMTLPLTKVTVSSGVITLADAPVFVTNDVVSVILEGQTKTYDRGLDGQKVLDLSPDRGSYVADSLIDTTNVPAGTSYLPSATGMSMDSFRDKSLSGELIDGDGTMSLALEVTNDEDITNARWIDGSLSCKNIKTGINAVAGDLTVTNGTLTFGLSFENLNFSSVRVKLVNDGATNTAVIKARRKSL